MKQSEYNFLVFFVMLIIMFVLLYCFNATVHAGIKTKAARET